MFYTSVKITKFDCLKYLELKTNSKKKIMLGVQKLATYAKTTELWNSYRWWFVWSFQASRQSAARLLMCSMRGIDLHIDLAVVYAKDYKCMHYCAKPLFQRQMNILPLLTQLSCNENWVCAIGWCPSAVS